MEWIGERVPPSARRILAIHSRSALSDLSGRRILRATTRTLAVEAAVVSDVEDAATLGARCRSGLRDAASTLPGVSLTARRTDTRTGLLLLLLLRCAVDADTLATAATAWIVGVLGSTRVPTTRLTVAFDTSEGAAVEGMEGGCSAASAALCAVARSNV